MGAFTPAEVVVGAERERFAKWLETRKGAREPEVERALLEVVGVYDAVEESGRLTRQQLAVLVEAASSPRTMLWSNVCSLLARLCRRFPEVGEAIVKLSESPQAHVRFR